MDQFFALTPDKILAAVESTGLVCTGRCLPLNSMENRVFEIELDLSAEEEERLTSPYDRFRVVKFYRPGRWSKEQIEEEHAFVAELLADESPVVAPLRSGSDQRTLHRLEQDNIWFTIFPKVGGRINYEMSDASIQHLGRLLAKLHITGSRRESKHRLHLNPDTYGRQNLLFLKERQVLPLDLASQYERLVEQLIDISQEQFERCTMTRIHGDCHLGNVLWGGQGPLWVDFDDMVMGPAVQDIWLLVPNRDAEGMRQRNLFLEAYESLIHFDRESLKLIEVLRALRYIHYSTWIAKRWEDPSFKKAFPDFNTWQYWQGQIKDLEVQLSFIKADLNK